MMAYSIPSINVSSPGVPVLSVMQSDKITPASYKPRQCCCIKALWTVDQYRNSLVFMFPNNLRQKIHSIASMNLYFRIFRQPGFRLVKNVLALMYENARINTDNGNIKSCMQNLSRE